MKKLLIGTMALALIATINLSAQNNPTTSTTPNKEQAVTNTTQQQNAINNQLSVGNKFQNKQINSSLRNQVCDGTQKRLHKQSNYNRCDFTGSNNNRRGRR